MNASALRLDVIFPVGSWKLMSFGALFLYASRMTMHIDSQTAGEAPLPCPVPASGLATVPQ